MCKVRLGKEAADSEVLVAWGKLRRMFGERLQILKKFIFLSKRVGFLYRFITGYERKKRSLGR